MQSDQSILSFLRDPQGFSKSVQDGSVWMRGLTDFVLPDISGSGSLPLREAQIAAWEGLSHQRAGLILGPPGTGKTFVLSRMVSGYMRALEAEGRPGRTFLTAFTRNAIGNLLNAVAKEQAAQESPLQILYLGRQKPKDLTPGITHILPGKGAHIALAQKLASGRVVLGATIWGLWQMVRDLTEEGVRSDVFDLVCIDEASQMVVSNGLLSLAAISASGRLIVAGDDKQLPPVRAGRTVEVEGRELGGSLYAFLKSAAIAEFPLTETFRLNAPLAAFPEQKFYPGQFFSRVEAGGDRLVLAKGWEDQVAPLSKIALNPDVPVVVIVHNSGGGFTSNQFEADLASTLAADLRQSLESAGFTDEEFWQEKLAVVSPHRAQNRLIRSKLPSAMQTHSFVETVDRIQGKERDAIILSYCVSDPEFALMEDAFIFSSERLNVATTRARFKLILIISQQLLDTLPTDQQIVDKAELLREFVHTCDEITQVSVPGPAGGRVNLTIRARGFTDENPFLPDFASATGTAAEVTALTPELEDVLTAIKNCIGGYPSAPVWKIHKELRRDPFADCVQLHHLGHLSFYPDEKRPGAENWKAQPLTPARPCTGLEDPLLDARLLRAIDRSPKGYYWDIRREFAWMDIEGRDVLWPHIERLAGEGRCRIDLTDGRFVLPASSAEASAEDRRTYVPDPDLTDDDFHVLNALEDIEAARINFGVYETWVSASEIRRALGLSHEVILSSLHRLEQAGQIMSAPEGRIRSRMAELAREVRFVKQRFRHDDADERPFLVRGIKIEISPRNKPDRNVSLRAILEAVRADLPASLQESLEDIFTGFSRLWNVADPQLAGFQARALTSIVRAWAGGAEDTFAIAANTGAGKTEAALLGLMAGALADSRSGLAGTKVVLAYPRVRLVANQAQRMAYYFAAVAKHTGTPSLSLGLQTALVPWRHRPGAPNNPGWSVVAPDTFLFPFFECPEPACESPLHLQAQQGRDGYDRLVCPTCGWAYDAWAGSKEVIASSPPDFFLPTTDSLHQWLARSEYGNIWGDSAGFSAPRALVADEIHLYTHIHGAQVGYAFQRLLGRCAHNQADGRRPLAIGMSATIGDPARIWNTLVGRSTAQTIEAEPEETSLNPRGREYFYFVQPEIESRNRDIAGASTTIQSLMCLAHGMRRRKGRDGGYRALVFFDSIDKMRRLHSDYFDAEMSKRLARLRITDHADGPDGSLRDQCCGQPLTCDRFNDGECWWFAAQDARQWGAAGLRHPGERLEVAQQPVFSGTGSDAESLIRRSDIVFTTSSLEVGYDDPDISLVYQHYAPMNLASFIQRKGRGGRGSDDRPLTAVTLSLYSPRDRWWYREPRAMISPARYDTPINLDNAFVLRGQVLATLLDGFARFGYADAAPLQQLIAAEKIPASVSGYVETIFGPTIWQRLCIEGASEFWAAALINASGPLSHITNLPDLRECLPWCPRFLFDTVNLPSLKVTGESVPDNSELDIAQILPLLAPGNATRRFNATFVHWRPVCAGHAPWLSAEDYKSAEAQSLGFTEAADLLAQLPAEARPHLADLNIKVCRPTRISVERLGNIRPDKWNGYFTQLQNAQGPIVTAPAGADTIRHDSRGELRGSILVSTKMDAARQLSPPSDHYTAVSLFAGQGPDAADAGLSAAVVYWGVDAELRFDAPRKPREPAALSQFFVSPKNQKPLLHGYTLDTEGVQFDINADALDAHAQRVVELLETRSDLKKWYNGQWLRYRMEAGARALGINAYQARRGADLFVAASSHPDTASSLKRLLRLWDADKLAALFEEARMLRLRHHPMYSKARVEKTARALCDQEVRALLAATIEEMKDPAALPAYIRTATQHALGLRLKQAIARISQSDPARLILHMRLPLQFAETADTRITICEAGEKGDGTTRTLAERWPDFCDLVAGDFMAHCPNATEDALLAAFWRQPSRHAAWRSLDPGDTPALRRMLTEIDPDLDVDHIPTRLQRILFSWEDFTGYQFEVYRLAQETEAVRETLETEMGRRAQDWELVSAVVSQAEAGTRPTLSELLKSYSRVQATEEETDEIEAAPDAPSRLADQIMRLSAPLCQDGCPACVHQKSDMMSDSLVEASTSRFLLKTFLTS